MIGFALGLVLITQACLIALVILGHNALAESLDRIEERLDEFDE